MLPIPFIGRSASAGQIANEVATRLTIRDASRIVYLSGLGDEQQPLSKHLRSRQEVGAVLRESGTQVVEFGASIVIGSGSLSFELIRALVRRCCFRIWLGDRLPSF